MTVTRLHCPHVGCAATADVKAPYDDRAIESARGLLRKHRWECHRGQRSLSEGRPAAKWEYETQ